MLNNDLIVGAADAAKFMGVTPRAVFHMCENGNLPHVKRGRRLFFRKSELDAYFRSSKGEAA